MDKKSASTKVDSLCARIIDQDVAIVNTDGFCIASSNPSILGTVVKARGVEHSSKFQLENGSRINIFYDKNKFNSKELNLIKSLTRFVLHQYLSDLLEPTSSLDQLVADFITQPLSQEKIKRFEKDAEIYGLDLNLKRTAILIQIANFSEDNLVVTHGNYTQEDVLDDWKNKINTTIADFFTNSNDLFTVYIGHDSFVCFKEIKDDEEKFIRYMKNAYLSIFNSLLNSQADNLLVSFSNAHSGAVGLHESFNEALQAAKIGQKFAHDQKHSFYYGDLGTLRIIAEENINKKKDFAHEVLEPLSKETLRLTLEVFLNENMNVNKAAKKLKVHPNTINYRLEKIAETLGLDPRVFKQAFELRIALLTDKILQD